MIVPPPPHDPPENDHTMKIDNAIHVWHFMQMQMQPKNRGTREFLNVHPFSVVRGAPRPPGAIVYTTMTAGRCLQLCHLPPFCLWAQLTDVQWVVGGWVLLKIREIENVVQYSEPINNKHARWSFAHNPIVNAGNICGKRNYNIAPVQHSHLFTHFVQNENELFHCRCTSLTKILIPPGQHACLCPNNVEEIKLFTCDLHFSS